MVALRDLTLCTYLLHFYVFYIGQLVQKQMLNTPLLQGQQRTVNTHQRVNTPHNLNTQAQIVNQPLLRTHHPARPNNVKGHSKDLMSQVVASTMKQRADHPRKYVDYYDNGATWDRFMSKTKGHQSEMTIDDQNYHVRLKYGSHDELEQNDKLNGNHDMETYPGETISGENSLSKFMAPPVYDEDEDNNYLQPKAEVEEKYVPDSPEAAATEKQNTEQLVNRLNSLMTPLSPPFDADGEKKSIKGIINIQNKQLRKLITMRNGLRSYEDAYNSGTQQKSPLAREKIHYGKFHYGNRGDTNEEHIHKMNDPSERSGDGRTQFADKENDHYPNIRVPNRKDDGDEDNDEENFQRHSGILQGRRYHKKYDNAELDHERLLNSRGNAMHSYGHTNRERNREREDDETNENLRDSDDTSQDLAPVEERGESRGDSRSVINLNTTPEKEFDAKFNEEGIK